MTNRKTTKSTMTCDEIIQRLSTWVNMKVSGDVLSCLSKSNDNGKCVSTIAVGLYDGFYGVDEKFTSLVNALFAGRKAHDEMRSVHLSGVREAIVAAIITQKKIMAELESVVAASESSSLEEVTV